MLYKAEQTQGVKHPMSTETEQKIQAEAEAARTYPVNPNASELIAGMDWELFIRQQRMAFVEGYLSGIKSQEIQRLEERVKELEGRIRKVLDLRDTCKSPYALYENGYNRAIDDAEAILAAP